MRDFSVLPFLIWQLGSGTYWSGRFVNSVQAFGSIRVYPLTHLLLQIIESIGFEPSMKFKTIEKWRVAFQKGSTVCCWRDKGSDKETLSNFKGNNIWSRRGKCYTMCTFNERSGQSECSSLRLTRGSHATAARRIPPFNTLTRSVSLLPFVFYIVLFSHLESCKFQNIKSMIW